MQLAHAITELGGSFRFLEVDDAFCDLLRTSRQKIFDRAVLDVTHEADRSRNEQLLRDLVEIGTPFTICKRYKRDDGTIVRVENQVARTLSARGKARVVASVKFMGELRVVDMIEEAEARAKTMREQTDALKMLLIGRS